MVTAFRGDIQLSHRRVFLGDEDQGKIVGRMDEGDMCLITAVKHSGVELLLSRFAAVYRIEADPPHAMVQVLVVTGNSAGVLGWAPSFLFTLCIPSESRC